MTMTCDYLRVGSAGDRMARQHFGMASRRQHRCDPECRSDHQIHAMHWAFRSTGGLLPQAEVSELMHRYRGPDAGELANRIRTRELVAFEWRDEVWLPMFQFSRKTLSVHEALRPVFEELAVIYDPRGTASWFALPNIWLAERTPVEMLLRDLSAVRYAARVDRFIAQGEAAWDKPSKTTQRINSLMDAFSVPAGRSPRQALTTRKCVAAAAGALSENPRSHALARAGAAFG